MSVALLFYMEGQKGVQEKRLFFIKDVQRTERGLVADHSFFHQIRYGGMESFVNYGVKHITGRLIDVQPYALVFKVTFTKLVRLFFKGGHLNNPPV